MEFKLKQFAKKELKNYLVKTVGEYNIDNPSHSYQTREIEALIYKKKERTFLAKNDGGRVTGGLSGKTRKINNLKINEIIIVEGLEYKIVEVTPRIYADFIEFSMELMRNGE